jgi:cobalt-precorrin-5B (C1)-methyltransferase
MPRVLRIGKITYDAEKWIGGIHVHFYGLVVTEGVPKVLRRGWTTGACATAATKAALIELFTGKKPSRVSIRLPRGETPSFDIVVRNSGQGWAEAGIRKDAGDDPDVTHGLTIISRVQVSDGGLKILGGEGVGTVTRKGLPVDVGEPAINPVPRLMIDEVVSELCSEYGRESNIVVEISIPGGDEVAKKTWNPRLGIVGGLSILGTTGIVRPFSCAAWIASIHRGIDVARASGLDHVAGCTGATSEKVVQELYGLSDQAMLDMGDFVGGMLKYLRRHPVRVLTIGGGIGKLSKLALGEMDLHSSRSQIDFSKLATLLDDSRAVGANTALEVYERIGPKMAETVARAARRRVLEQFEGYARPEHVNIVVIDRAGNTLARCEE